MKHKPTILATWIMCPDGTMLPSFHGHDYREHLTIDKQELQHPDGVKSDLVRLIEQQERIIHLLKEQNNVREL